MSISKLAKAAIRSLRFRTLACVGWERDLVMFQFRESELRDAARKGMLPEGAFEYATEEIQLQIQGKSISKTRYQWARFQSPESTYPMPRYPFRSYDTHKTQGIIIHNALLDLVDLSKAHPEMSLDQLYEIIQKRYWD